MRYLQLTVAILVLVSLHACASAPPVASEESMLEVIDRYQSSPPSLHLQGASCPGDLVAYCVGSGRFGSKANCRCVDQDEIKYRLGLAY